MIWNACFIYFYVHTVPHYLWKDPSYFSFLLEIGLLVQDEMSHKDSLPFPVALSSTDPLLTVHLYLHPYSAPRPSYSRKWYSKYLNHITIDSGLSRLFSIIFYLNFIKFCFFGFGWSVFHYIVLMAGMFTTMSSQLLWLIFISQSPSNLQCTQTATPPYITSYYSSLVFSHQAMFLSCQ